MNNINKFVDKFRSRVILREPPADIVIGEHIFRACLETLKDADHLAVICCERSGNCDKDDSCVGCDWRRRHDLKFGELLK